MSDSDVLSKFMGSRASQREPGGQSEAEQPEDLGAFGWLRGTRERAVMLELRKSDRTSLAIGYGWLERVQFDPSEGITLWAAGQKITLSGRNLNAEVRPTVRLFDGLIRHRVPWVQEADRGQFMESADTDTIIERIHWS